MTKIMEALYSFVWGVPTLVLILGVGIYLAVTTRWVQLRLLGAAFRHFRRSSRDGYRALCTALAATVGTGNLVGVSGAICLGGPGAVFWMLLCGLLGMGIKFAEAALAVHLHSDTPRGCIGGPMYMIQNGLPDAFRPLAVLYCLLGIAASLGMGNAAQVSAVVSGVQSALNRELSPVVISCTTAGLLALVFLGGASAIGKTAEGIVPIAVGGYVFLCLVFLILRIQRLPDAAASILHGAFSPRAVTGGAVGSALQAVRLGCSRGLFTNEAGMGTAAIAHGSAQNDPIQQGMMGLLEVFIDTIVVCTLTALVVLTSGIPIPFGLDSGAAVTVQAFSSVYGRWAQCFVGLFLSGFAFATIIGWSLYGLRCAQFLFGPGAAAPFFLAQLLTAAMAGMLQSGLIWKLSEILNGLMVFPNLFALVLLSPVLYKLLDAFSARPDTIGGNLCKSQSTQTAANPLPCENSTPSQWKPQRTARKSTI